MSASDVLPPPSGSAVNQPRDRRRIARTWTVVAIGVLAAGGTGIALAAGQGRDSHEPGVTLTSVDGTFSLTLPAGWDDVTDEYRSAYLADTGQESSIEGAAVIDDLPLGASQNFVTISGHTVNGVLTAAQPIGQDAIDYWMTYYDDAVQSGTGTFTTEAGDEVWHSRLRGTKDGSPGEMVIAVVVGDHFYAEFDLELRPEFYDAEDELVEALQTLEFSEGPDTSPYETWAEPYLDGRTYAVKGSASMLVPEGWIVEPPTRQASETLASEANLDAIGTWTVQVDPDSSDTLDNVGVTILVWTKQQSTLSAADALALLLGEVDTTVTDPSGVVLTIEAIDPWGQSVFADAARATVREDFSELSGDLEGPFARQYMYQIQFDDGTFVGITVTADERVSIPVDAIEAALLTIEVQVRGA